MVALVVVYLWHCKSKHRNELQSINPEGSSLHNESFEKTYDATELRGVASDPIVKVSVACVWDNLLKVVFFLHCICRS